jgi:hypothetical protein
MKPKWIVGIDYSMSCPAITIAKSTEAFSFSTCQLRYLTDRVPVTDLLNVVGTRFTNDCSTNEERFDIISSWAISCIPTTDVVVFIEDYSFASKGKVFHIAENTGLLKHKIFKLGIPICAIAPTVVKKLARGKGKGTKDEMHAAFIKETGIDLMPIYQPRAEAVGSPVGDLVDSFYICKYGYLKG